MSIIKKFSPDRGKKQDQQPVERQKCMHGSRKLPKWVNLQLKMERATRHIDQITVGNKKNEVCAVLLIT